MSSISETYDYEIENALRVRVVMGKEEWKAGRINRMSRKDIVKRLFEERNGASERLFRLLRRLVTLRKEGKNIH